MVLAFSALFPLVPIALAAVALGRVTFETAHHDHGVRGIHERADLAAVLAALATLASFLLSLDALPQLRDRVLVAALAGALWIAERARRAAPLAPLVIFASGLLGGAEPRLGIGLAPALVAALVVSLRGSDRRREALRALLVLGLGFALGHWGLNMPGRALALPDAPHLGAWALGAARELGPLGLAFSLAGLLIALADTGRRRLAVTAVLLVAADAGAGGFGAPSALALSLGLGLGLMEARVRTARLSLPGAQLVLVPLVALALVEPVGARLLAQPLRWPTLGPVPPHDAPPVRRAPTNLSPVRR